MSSRAEKGQDYGPFDGCFNLIVSVLLLIVMAVVGVAGG